MLPTLLSLSIRRGVYLAPSPLNVGLADAAHQEKAIEYFCDKFNFILRAIVGQDAGFSGTPTNPTAKCNYDWAEAKFYGESTVSYTGKTGDIPF